VKRIVERNDTISPAKFILSECYSYAQTDHWLHNTGAVPFVSLADFIVDFFISCLRGSQDDVIKIIAEGKDPTPILDRSGSDKEDESPASGVMAKHTLRIKVTSDLPEVEGMIHPQE
jgi:hypothetical protein